MGPISLQGRAWARRRKILNRDRRVVNQAFSQFSPSQRSALTRAGMTPDQVKVTSGRAAESFSPEAGQGPRRIVIGRETLRTQPASLTHELGHQLLSIKYPRTGKLTGMGIQHVAMGVAGDVIEGPNSNTRLDTKRLEGSYSGVLRAIRQGASWKELKGAAFAGGVAQIGRTRGGTAAQGEAFNWRGGRISSLTQLLARPVRKNTQFYGSPRTYREPAAQQEVRSLNAEMNRFNAMQSRRLERVRKSARALALW